MKFSKIEKKAIWLKKVNILHEVDWSMLGQGYGRMELFCLRIAWFYFAVHRIINRRNRQVGKNGHFGRRPIFQKCGKSNRRARGEIHARKCGVPEEWQLLVVAQIRRAKSQTLDE